MSRRASAMLSAAFLAMGAVLARPDAATTVQRLEKRLAEMEARQAELERRLAAAEGREPSPSTPSAKLKVGSSGIAFESASADFKLGLRGLFNFDARAYPGAAEFSARDGFSVARARTPLSATLWSRLDFQLTPEFAATGGPALYDAHANLQILPGLELRAGKYKQPFGLERWQPIASSRFPIRALPSLLMPDRDVGLMLHGAMGEGLFEYQASLVNGAGDGRLTSNADLDGGKEMIARVFSKPWLHSGSPWLNGLGFGLAGSFGRKEGESGLPANSAYRLESASPFFQYRDATAGPAQVVADGHHWRLSPQMYCQARNFGLMLEHVRVSQEVRAVGQSTAASLGHSASQMTLSYVLTGEPALFSGVVPARGFGMAEPGWGAFELVGRVSNIQMDPRSFPAYSASPVSGATAFSLGLNWHLNGNLRASLSHIHTEFDPAPGATPSGAEDAVLARMQLTF